MINISDHESYCLMQFNSRKAAWVLSAHSNVNKLAYLFASQAAAGSSPQGDLFGDSLIGDLLDTPIPVPTQDSNRNSKSKEVDLFADAAFVSAPTSAAAPVFQVNSTTFVSAPTCAAAPASQVGLCSRNCADKVDLFASLPTAAASSPAVDFFAAPEQVVAPEMKPTEWQQLKQPNS
ncbi:clathrin interactor EPSIN 1 isoform X1 [Tanacetum coccineum]